MVDLYVNPLTGNDANAGTALLPVRTLAGAQVRWRALSSGLTEDVNVWLHPATYDVTAPLVLTATDNRRAAGYWLRIRGTPVRAKRPLLTATSPVTGWVVSGDRWVTTLPLGTIPPSFVRYRNTVLSRAEYTAGGLQRVVSWNEGARTITVPRGAFDAAEAGAQMVIRIIMGWCMTQSVVQSFTVSGADATVTLPTDVTDLEFAKGTPGVHANLSLLNNMPFGFGPYHAPGQAFTVSGAVNYCDAPGEFAYNPTTRLLTVFPLTDVIFSDFAANALIPNGQPTVIRNTGATDVQIVGCDFEDLGWEGGSLNYVGYDQGIRFVADGAGGYAFEDQPAAIEALTCEGLSLVDCGFREIAAAGFRAQRGVKRVSLTGCWFQDIDGQGSHINYTDAISETAGAANQVDGVSLHDCTFENVGRRLAGNGAMVGAAANVSVTQCTVDGTASAGLSFGWGSRFDNDAPANYMQRGLLCAQNLIGRALLEQVDDGSIYTNGNWAANAAPMTTPSTVPVPGARIMANMIHGSEPSGLDPQGGEVPSVYTDLGSTQIRVGFNQIVGGDLALQENCARASDFTGNNVTDVAHRLRVFHSGFSYATWDTGTSTSYRTAYTPPFSLVDDFNWSGALYEMTPPADMAPVVSAGLTLVHTWTGAERGVPAFEITLTGTPTADEFILQTPMFAALAGQIHPVQTWAVMSASTGVTNVLVERRGIGWDGLAVTEIAATSIFATRTAWRRYTAGAGALGNGGTANVAGAIRFRVTPGIPVNVRMRIGAMTVGSVYNLQKGAFRDMTPGWEIEQAFETLTPSPVYTSLSNHGMDSAVVCSGAGVTPAAGLKRRLAAATRGVQQ